MQQAPLTNVIAAIALSVLAVVSAGAVHAEVVRIHGIGPERLGELRRHFDYWGVDWREDYAVFNLSADQRRTLERAGFRVTSDARRQAELDAWNALDHATRLAGDPDTVPGFACYRSVSKTNADLAALAVQYPDRAEWVDIGDSWQAGAGSATGDSLYALVIANANSPHPKAPLVVMAAQHARELATAEIATRFAELLVENPDNDPDIAWLADHREIHIIAQQNPDGRRQVEQGQAFWRKNHNETACAGGTEGIDLNRNSPVFWGDFSSGSDCSEVYRGPVQASEPETQAIQNYLDSVFDAQRPGSGVNDPAPDTAEGLFISLHSFGELVLLPWEGLGGGNQNNAPNHDALTILGRRFGFLTDYEVSRWQSLGPAGGTTVDFAYSEFGVAAYTFEVGTSFQQSCASFESSVWPDNRDALRLAAGAARRPYLEPAGPAITALAADQSAGPVSLSGTADDTRYFRGGVSEPPITDPVEAIVELRVSPGVPEELAGPAWTFPIASPATTVAFEITLPAGATLAANGRLFVTAVDAQGRTGIPRVVVVDSLFNDGFES